ncbi:pyruvate kinase [Infirmifilum uzonense]|uniref:pyruvate kinase n=1 Tax=Infirmifilum uzonense TaxID=1550241 RepID=UPI00069B709A|nr:pyruvate kinase [Infirmifilum uzonense]
MTGRKTKIIATIGPSSWSEDILKRLFLEGVEGFRFNFSHADYEVFRGIAAKLRSLETPQRPVTLIADLQGPVVRLGGFDPIQVHPGDKVTFVQGERSSEGIPIPLRTLFELASQGDLLYVEGGRLAFQVLFNDGEKIQAESLLEGELKPKKTITIKGKEYPLPSLTEKDVGDVKFAVENGFDAIALSFVRHEGDIRRLRELLYDLKAEDVKIIAKIETRSSVENLEPILEHSDMVLVARGDLANFYNLEEIYRVQEDILRKARLKGKPSIVATQLLESMINNPVPTRSEVVDVITAVKMDADALMLAGETAAGKYPVVAVSWLKRIIVEAEKLEKGQLADYEPQDHFEAIAKGVALLSNIIGGKILAFSERGNTARRLAKFRPSAEMIVYTNWPPTARYINLLKGVRAVYEPSLNKHSPSLFSELLDKAVKMGFVSVGDIVVFTAGRRRGSTDLISVERVQV